MEKKRGERKYTCGECFPIMVSKFFAYACCAARLDANRLFSALNLASSSFADDSQI